MRRLVAFIVGIALVPCIAARVPAAPGDTTAPDLGRAAAYVTDDAGLLKAREQGRIERYLGKVEHELGVQFAVVTVETTRPQTIEEFAVEQFERWGIGGAKSDEGLLLVVARADRKIRFEVGYGLEGVLPDGRVGGIIRGKITPAFREGRFGAGILDGLVEAARFVAEAKGLPPPVPDEDDAPPEPETEREIPMWMLIVIAIFILMAIAGGIGGGRGRGRRRGSGWNDPVWWSTGGGGWSGGGFGGGSSGGGFGGFGGGASGGGGATGSW